MTSHLINNWRWKLEDCMLMVTIYADNRCADMQASLTLSSLY